MVCCSYPFGHDGKAELGGERAHVVYSRIRARVFKEHGQLEKCCSPALQDVIKGMLTVDVRQRFGILQIKEHPWMRDAPWPTLPRCSSGGGFHESGEATGDDSLKVQWYAAYSPSARA